MSPGTPGPHAVRAVLRGDVVFWLATSVLLLAVVPYVLPLLDAEQFRDWRYVYADIPVSVAALIAASIAVVRLGSAERHFWRLLVFAYGAVVVVELANAFLPLAALTPLVKLLLDSGFLVYFAALMLAAAASQGGALEQGVWNLHRLRSVGLSVLGIGFLVYFQVVPRSAGTGAVAPWYPGLFMFAALDVAVMFMFLRARGRHEDPRWRGILLGLAAVSALNAVVDAWEAVLYLEPFQGMELAPFWDLAWFTPTLLFVAVARRYLADPSQAAVEPTIRLRPKPDRGLLVVGLFAFPVLHVSLYYLDVLNPELRQTREGFVALFALVMGGITLVYFRLLEREREVNERERGLSEQRYRSFVRARSDGIYRAEVRPSIAISSTVESQILEIESRVRIAEASDVLHLPDGVPSAPVGGSLEELFPPGGLWRDGLRRWIESGYRIELEVVHRDSDGQSWYYRYGLTGIVENGELRRIWLTRWDITPRRRADREAERLYIELEQSRKLESLGTLAGGLADNFNNLLAPIMGYTELAREAIDRNDPGAGDNLQHVLAASKRAAHLVEQVLFMSRDQPRQRVPVRLQETVRAATNLIRTGLPSSIAIDTTLDDDCPPVFGEASRLHQLVVNLCTNAAQAIGSASGRIQIRLRPEEGDSSGDPLLGWVVLEVEDDARRVSAAIDEGLFAPFATTEAPEEAPALGLSVVHGIVTSHEGRITIDSDPGAGTKVIMHFPATARDRMEDHASPLRLPRRSLRILVVDDEEAVAGVASSILTTYGHEVTATTDPFGALKELRGRPDYFDVVLADYSMPGLTGLDLVDAIRDVAPHAGIVLSSGYSLADRQLTRGVVHLAKPFTTGQLVATVQRANALARTSRDADG